MRIKGTDELLCSVLAVKSNFMYVYCISTAYMYKVKQHSICIDFITKKVGLNWKILF